MHTTSSYAVSQCVSATSTLAEYSSAYDLCNLQSGNFATAAEYFHSHAKDLRQSGSNCRIWPPYIYFHSVPTDKSPIPGIGKYCNTVTAASAVVFELDTSANFEVKRIPHKRRNSSGFILTATKSDFISLKLFILIGITVQIIGISVLC